MAEEPEVALLLGEGLANFDTSPVAAALNLLRLMKVSNDRRGRVFLQKRLGKRRGRRAYARAKHDGWFLQSNRC